MELTSFWVRVFRLAFANWAAESRLATAFNYLAVVVSPLIGVDAGGLVGFLISLSAVLATEALFVRLFLIGPYQIWKADTLELSGMKAMLPVLAVSPAGYSDPAPGQERIYRLMVENHGPVAAENCAGRATLQQMGSGLDLNLGGVRAEVTLFWSDGVSAPSAACLLNPGSIGYLDLVRFPNQSTYFLLGNTAAPRCWEGRYQLTVHVNSAQGGSVEVRYILGFTGVALTLS